MPHKTCRNGTGHTAAPSSVLVKPAKRSSHHQPWGAKKLNGYIGRLRNTPNKTTPTKIQTIAEAERALSSNNRRLLAGSIQPTPLTRRNGTHATIKGLYPKAATIRPCNKLCKARIDPHPGQYHPVKYLNGQGGNQRLSTGLYFTNKTQANKDPRKSTTGRHASSTSRRDRPYTASPRTIKHPTSGQNAKRPEHPTFRVTSLLKNNYSISILRFFCLAASVLGMRISSTPLSKVALACSVTTSPGKRIEREKLP